MMSKYFVYAVMALIILEGFVDMIDPSKSIVIRSLGGLIVILWGLMLIGFIYTPDNEKFKKYE